MDAWRPRTVKGGGVRRVRAGGHSAVGRGHRGHLPLEELQDHVDVRRHSGLQSGRGERERSADEHSGVKMTEAPTQTILIN